MQGEFWDVDGVRVRTCTQCRETLAESEFMPKGRAQRLRSECRRCFRAARARGKKDGFYRSRRKWKSEAIAAAGGECVDCGLRTEFEAVYDFHHTGKKRSGGLTTTRSRGSFMREVMKCVLLCANCHRIRHEKERRASGTPLLPPSG